MKTIWKVIIGIVIFIMAFTIWQYFTKDYNVESVEVTKNTSVNVDSLKNKITYWKTIAKENRNTVKVDTVTIVKYKQKNDSVRVYTTSYQDSTLKAKWDTKIKGELKNQSFQYTIKQKKVVA